MPEDAERLMVSGAKGIGESGLMPTSPAVANAIGGGGVCIKELPLTPERVLRALRAAHAEPRP